MRQVCADQHLKPAVGQVTGLPDSHFKSDFSLTDDDTPSSKAQHLVLAAFANFRVTPFSQHLAQAAFANFRVTPVFQQLALVAFANFRVTPLFQQLALVAFANFRVTPIFQHLALAAFANFRVTSQFPHLDCSTGKSTQRELISAQKT